MHQVSRRDQDSLLLGSQTWAHARGAEHQRPQEQQQQQQGTSIADLPAHRASSSQDGGTVVEGLGGASGIRQRRNGMWRATMFDPSMHRTVMLGDFATQQEALAVCDRLVRQLHSAPWAGCRSQHGAAAAAAASPCSQHEPTTREQSWARKPSYDPHAAAASGESSEHGRSKRHKPDMPAALTSLPDAHPSHQDGQSKQHQGQATQAPLFPKQRHCHGAAWHAVGTDVAGSRRESSCAASTTFTAGAVCSEPAPAAHGGGSGAAAGMCGGIQRMAQLSEPLAGRGSGALGPLPGQHQQQQQQQEPRQGSTDDSASSAACSGQQSCASPSTACWGSAARGGDRHKHFSLPSEAPTGGSGLASASQGTLGHRSSGEPSPCHLDIRLAQLTAASAKSHVSSLQAQIAACEANAAKQRLLLQQQLEDAKAAAKREKQRLKQALAVSMQLAPEGAADVARPSTAPAHSHPSLTHPLPSRPSFVHPSSSFHRPGFDRPPTGPAEAQLSHPEEPSCWVAGGRDSAGAARRRTAPDLASDPLAMPSHSGQAWEQASAGAAFAYDPREATPAGSYGHQEPSRAPTRRASPSLMYSTGMPSMPGHAEWQPSMQQHPLPHHPHHARPHPWLPPFAPSSADALLPSQLARKHSHAAPRQPRRSHATHDAGMHAHRAPVAMPLQTPHPWLAQEGAAPQPPAGSIEGLQGERRRKSSKAAKTDPPMLAPHFHTHTPADSYLHSDPGVEALHSDHPPPSFVGQYPHPTQPFFYPPYMHQHPHPYPYAGPAPWPAPKPTKKRKDKTSKVLHSEAVAAAPCAMGPAAIPVAATAEPEALHGAASHGGGAAAAAPPPQQQPRRRRNKQQQQQRQPMQAEAGQGPDALLGAGVLDSATGAAAGPGDMQEADLPFAEGLMAALAAASEFQQSGEAGAEAQAHRGPSDLNQGQGLGQESGEALASPAAAAAAAAAAVAAAAAAAQQAGLEAVPNPAARQGAGGMTAQEQQQQQCRAEADGCSGGATGGAAMAPAPPCSGQPDMAALAAAFPMPDSGTAQIPAWDELERCLFSDGDDLFQDLF